MRLELRFWYGLPKFWPEPYQEYVDYVPETNKFSWTSLILSWGVVKTLARGLQEACGWLSKAHNWHETNTRIRKRPIINSDLKQTSWMFFVTKYYVLHSFHHIWELLKSLELKTAMIHIFLTRVCQIFVCNCNCILMQWICLIVHLVQM